MRVEHAEARPHPALRGLVARLVGYRIDGAAPGMHIGMPSRHLTVILTLDEPISVGWHCAGSPVTVPRLVSGLHAGPAFIHHDGRQYGVQLALTPAGARQLLGLPAGELCGNVDLDALTGASVRRLAERCAHLPAWPARLDLVQQWLVAQVDRRRAQVRPELDWAWRQLAGAHGAVPVAELARQVGWSRRHLGVSFGAEYGLSPKTAARVMRFERSHRMVQHQLGAGRLKLAEVAAACGYADQSHLNRDWAQFAGTSPTRWAQQDELAFVRDSVAAEASS